MPEKNEPLFQEDMRLLPWTTDTGKPCYLAEGAAGGVISALADGTEARQTRDAVQALREAEDVLANPAAGALALRLALHTCVRALAKVLRVAESRGLRLGAADPDGT
ncbi:hypothetical protein MMF93_20440 [Streptomyces tubbatahanensis]|uniref:Uncharacterized protein n=1 Tax=Streptomyces tubbatahanensis TaxID=2923272 RepID=A0ABY3XW07_9ACTN|nr:hypothetical protein [Streptomyces tubbatahanensis]UNS98560.1 hypothetical protein MMF93_20440 [Streptomyces tubbatahanensis]